MTPRPTIEELEARVREAISPRLGIMFGDAALSDLAARAREAEAKLQKMEEDARPRLMQGHYGS